MKIKQVHEQFCEYQIAFKGFSPKTILGYQIALGIFLKHFPEINSFEQITETKVQKFFYWGRTERNWLPATFITYHKRLKVFFDYLVKNSFIAKNPFENIDKPSLGRRLPKALTKQQAQQILDKALHESAVKEFTRIRNHAMYTVFLHAGLRKGEVLKLTMQDVDLTNNRLSIREAKGDKDRFVPISSKLHSVLTRYVNLRVKEGKYAEQFFVSSNRDVGLTDNGLKHVQDTMEALVDFKFHLHKLRHTFATLMLDGGCNIYTLSKIMGHSDIKTTTIYLSTSTELLQSEIHKHPLNLI